MALRLDLDFDARPRWTAMGDGVEFLMRPATTVDYAAAEAEAGERLKQAAEGVATLADLGLPAPDADDLANSGLLLGYSRLLVACALAGRIVGEWRGVYVSEGGKDVPLPLSARAMAVYLRDPGRHRTFEAAAYRRMGAVISEGKELPPRPNGSPAGAATTAPDAGKSAPDASAMEAAPQT
jgi:hypothetical protein